MQFAGNYDRKNKTLKLCTVHAQKGLMQEAIKP